MKALAKFLEKYGKHLDDVNIADAKKMASAMDERTDTWNLIQKLSKMSPKEATYIHHQYGPKLEKLQTKYDDAVDDVFFNQGKNFDKQDIFADLDQMLQREKHAPWREWFGVTNKKYKGREPK